MSLINKSFSGFNSFKTKDEMICSKKAIQKISVNKLPCNSAKKVPKSAQKAKNRISINLASLSSCRGDVLDDKDHEQTNPSLMTENRPSLFSTRIAERQNYKPLDLSDNAADPHEKCHEAPCGNLWPKLPPQSQREIIFENSGYRKAHKKSAISISSTHIGQLCLKNGQKTFSVKRDIQDK